MQQQLLMPRLSSPPEPQMISVVIPYFQRTPGVLRRAIASIVAQRDCPLPIHVIVVDDSSPVSAAGELESINLPDSLGITLIRQPNGGPGSARNTGLDVAPASTCFIAFLDSDDEWSPRHLARAVQALEAGFDFYFADHFQLDSQVSAFSRGGKLKASEHSLLPISEADIHEYQGEMIDQIMRGNVIGTSTVVYRRMPFESLRFRIEFTNAGEDYLFWLCLVQAGCRIIFSNQVETIYGHGVNVYAGATWGSCEHMLRIHNELKYRKILIREYCTTNAQRSFVRQAIHNLRRDFLADILHRVRNLKVIHISLLWKHLIEDPQTFLMAPWLVFEIKKPPR